MTNPIDPVEFGILKRDVELMRLDMLEIKNDLRAISADWQRAKGGTKVFMAIAAVVGGFLTMGIQYLITKFG